MLDKKQTREEGKRFAGSKMEDFEKGCWGEDTALLSNTQGKCLRCPYFPGRGYACNLVPCPFTEPGERLDAGEVERERQCIGFEERHFSDSDLHPQYPQYPHNCLSGEKAGEGLTSAGVSGNLAFPKYNERRTANAIPFPPRKGRSTRTSIAESSAYHALLGVTRRERGYIGRVQRPVSVKTRQPLIGLGSVVPCLSFYPQNNEVPHV